MKLLYTLYLLIGASLLVEIEAGMYDGSNKGLTSVPDDIPDSTTMCFLSKNKIKRIDTGKFSQQLGQVLQNLGFQKNVISDIADDAFINLKKLKYLFLDKNKLTQIKAKTFNGLRSLTSLYLKDNKITSIAAGAFNFKKLTHLYLNNNQLSVLQKNMFNEGRFDPGSKYHLYLDMAGNKWDCMRFKWIAPEKRLKSLYFINLKCISKASAAKPIANNPGAGSASGNPGAGSGAGKPGASVQNAAPKPNVVVAGGACSDKWSKSDCKNSLAVCASSPLIQSNCKKTCGRC